MIYDVIAGFFISRKCRAHDKYRMDDFVNWLKESKRLIQAMSEGDKAIELIRAAGQVGITELDLRKGAKLDCKLLDHLLTAMLRLRLIGVRQRNGERVFFSTGRFAPHDGKKPPLESRG